MRRGRGFVLADFDNRAVEANFTYHHIAGKQRAQFQLGHTAFDSNGHALSVIGIAPVGLSKMDAGREKGNSWRSVKLQRLAGGFGCGVGDLPHHKVRIHTADQYDRRHCQHGNATQNPYKHTFH